MAQRPIPPARGSNKPAPAAKGGMAKKAGAQKPATKKPQMNKDVYKPAEGYGKPMGKSKKSK